jgi:glutamyl-tRNA reductase
VSLAEIGVQQLRERVARTPGRVALIGVSPMTERAAVSLAKTGIALTIVNRSPDKAAALAARFGAEHVALDAFRREPPPVEALLTATGAEHAILNEAALERIAAKTPSGEPPLIVDMAVPPDVDPAVCAKLSIPRIGMDEIVRHAEQNRAARLLEAAPAREQVDEALEKLQDRFTERYYGPLFGALQRRYRRTAQEGVQRLLKKELHGLGDTERAAIETWTEVLARRFAHIPCLGLRGLLHDGPDGSLDAFLSGLEPELAAELRDALNGAAAPAETADSLGSRGEPAGGEAER